MGETIRVQMKISDETDARVRPALLKIAAELLGRRIESVVLPVELLQQFKASDFQTQHEYDEWKRRNLKILELGLLLHPKMPLDKKDSYAQQLTKIIHNNAYEVKTLREVAKKLACRSFQGDDSQTCHWADGIPLNLHLYQILLESLFDIETPTIIINEVDEMVEFMKRTWGILGINQKFHNICFLWVLFNRFLSTGQVENDLLSACANLLLEIKEDAYFDPDSGSDDQYSNILDSTLMFLFAWAEKGLLGYREFFYRGNVDMMRIVLSIGLFADELVVEESSYNAGTRDTVYDASEKVDTYIRSSMQKAFHQTMEKLRTKSQQQESINQNQLPDLCIIAQEITDLAFTEREIYSPILKSHHPLAVGVAVATLHSCFGQQVKAFVSSITDLTPDVIQVLISADKMEMCLVQMAVQDSFDSEDGGKSIIQEMSPYETEIVIADLVKSWMQTRLQKLTELVARNLLKEVWNPTVNKGRFGQSVVEILKTISDTLEAYFLLPIPLHASLLPDLTNKLDKCLQDYIFKAKSTSGTARNNFLPKITPLTKSKQNSIFESQIAENKTTKGDDNHYDDTFGILQLCVRVNTLTYIRKELEVFQERVVTQLRSTGTSHEGNIVKNYKIRFDLSLTACEDGTQELCEVIGYKLVFHELNQYFWKGLYVDGASSSRIEPFLERLELHLEEITEIIQDDSVRMRVITEIMRASCDGFLLVLLAGGQSRNFTTQDLFIIQEDFHLLVDSFWSHGDRLPTELISKFSAPVECILPLFATDTETLIEKFRSLVVVDGGRLPESGGPLPPDNGRWDRNDPNTILRVLCHRDDRVAFKFLKK